MMGAEAIKELLKRVEVEELSVELREKMKHRNFTAEEAQVRQASEGGGGVPQERQQTAMDDP